MNTAIMLLLLFQGEVDTADKAISHLEKSSAKLHALDFDWSAASARLSANAALLDEIASRLRELDKLVDTLDLTNQQKMQAKSAIYAIGAFVSAPDPEWHLVFETCRSKSVSILTSPTVSATVNGLSIIQFFAYLLEVIAG